jgi:phosphoribosyl 1,2-cyclic phosphate phosphodiesterase
MPHPLLTRDVRDRLLLLGTGTSHGVPVIGCGCPTCRDANPKNQRTRSSAILGLPGGNLLVDSPPDLRLQLVREGIGLVHSVFYTHGHADHLLGLDDLRIFADYLGHDLPVYCDEHVEARIRRAFDYAFDPVARQYPAGGVPRLVFARLSAEPVEILGVRVTPIPLEHGRHSCFGLRVGNVAYCTDAKRIPAASMDLLQGLDMLVLDALRRRPHPTHMSLDEAVEAARQLAPRRTLFTHIAHDLEHEATNAALPPTMQLAYDGLEVPLGLGGNG